MVSKNRFKASALCLQETAYVNLRDLYEAEPFDFDSIGNGGASVNSENENATATDADPVRDSVHAAAGGINIDNSHYDDGGFSSHCAYGDVHDKYEKYKRISIIDDGFTALNVKKDLNIILIDGTENLFGQFVIPAGVLREPVSSVRYANCIIISKTAEHDLPLEAEIRKYNKSCPIFYSYYVPSNIKGGLGGRETIPCGQALNGNERAAKKAAVICGIGNSEYFYKNIKSCGFDISDTLEYGDHHNYKYEDVLKLKSITDSHEDITIITTLKDYVKLKNFRLKLPDVIDKLYYLDFEVKIDGEFCDFIIEKYFDYIGNIKSELIDKVKNSLTINQ